MTEPTEHGPWREHVASAIIERRPPDPELAVHLAGCAECSDTWRQLSGASARLITAARGLPLEAEPPARLRRRVVAGRHEAGTATASGAIRTPSADSTARPRRRPWFGRVAWGTGGVLVGAVAAIALIMVSSPAPPSGRIALSGSSLAPEATGSVVLERLPEGSVRVELAISGLPRAEAGEFYELWLVGDGGRVSAGTFRSDGSALVRVFTTAADLAKYPRIGITLEPDDGDPAASDQRVAGSD